MGQYYRVFNLDTKQKLYPRSFDDGLKLMELGGSCGGTLSALALLLSQGEGRKGPWAGQRIVISGDYADRGKFVPEEYAEYNLQDYDNRQDEHDIPQESSEQNDVDDAVAVVHSGRFEEISADVRQLAAVVVPEGHALRMPIRTIPGLTKLLDDDAVFESVESMLETFGAEVQEDLANTICGVQYAMRMSDLKSSLAWNYGVDFVYIGEAPDEEFAQKITVQYSQSRIQEGPRRVTKYLEFPATGKQVREFLEIEAWSPRGK